MRKAVIVTVVLTLVLCGCEGNAVVREKDSPKPEMSQRFLCDKDSYRFSTVVDSKTGVTYLIWTDSMNADKTSGITVLLNRNGYPVISEEVTE